MILADVIDELVGILSTVPGVQGVGRPKDAQNEYPFIVIYPGTGTWNWGSPDGGRGRSTMYGPQSFNCDVHVQKNDMETRIPELEPYADEVATRIFAAFNHDRINQKVHRLVAVRWDLVNLGWGSDDTFGYRCIVDTILAQEVPDDNE